MISDYIELQINGLGNIEFFNTERVMTYLQNAPWHSTANVNLNCIRLDFTQHPDAAMLNIPCDPPPYLLPTEIDPCVLPPTPIDDCTAPWHDASDPNTFQFLGGIVQSMRGFDSNLSRELKARTIGEGSTWGNYKRPGRCMIFDVCLFAKTEGGLEAGVSYYESILEHLAICSPCDASMFLLDSCPDPGDPVGPRIKEIKSVSAQRGIQVLNTAFDKKYATIRFTICSEWSYIWDNECATSQNTALALPVTYLGKPDPEIQIVESTRARCNRNICINANGSWCFDESANPADFDNVEEDGAAELVQFGGTCNTLITTLTPYTPATDCGVTDPDNDTGCDDCCPCPIKIVYDGETFSWEPVQVKDIPPNLYPCANRFGDDGLWEVDPLLDFPDCDCPITLHEIWYPAPPGTIPRVDDKCDPPPEVCTTVQTVDIDLGPQEDLSGPYVFTPVDFTEPIRCACPIEIRNITYNDCGTIVTVANPDVENEIGIFTNTTNTFLIPGRDQVLFNKEVDEVRWIVNMCAIADTDEVGAFTSATPLPPAGGEGDISQACCCTVEPLPNGELAMLDYNMEFHGIPPINCHFSLWGDDDPCVVDTLTTFREQDCEDCNCERVIRLGFDTSIRTLQQSAQWTPVGWTVDECEAFPDPNCTYTVEGNLLTDETIFLGIADTVAPKPSWQSTCFNPNVLITGNASFFDVSTDRNGLNTATVDETCWVKPTEARLLCSQSCNNSKTKYADGTLSLLTGVDYIRNAEICGWCVPHGDYPLPCDDQEFWRNRETDFWARIPELPPNAELLIDSANRTSRLFLQSGTSEDALGYITTKLTGSFDYIEVPPCYCFYVAVAIDETYWHDGIVSTTSLCAKTAIGTGV